MKDILEKVNHNDGFTVPEGYFDEFAARMADSLPQQPWEQQPKVMPRSFWQKVRPYVYLAAMFMGVWCMMKMFDLMRTDSTGLSIDNNPVITAALSNDHFINDYFIDEGDLNDNMLLDDLYEKGVDPAVFSETDLEEEAEGDSAVFPDAAHFPMSQE